MLWCTSKERGLIRLRESSDERTGALQSLRQAVRRHGVGDPDVVGRGEVGARDDGEVGLSEEELGEVRGRGDGAVA